MKELIQLFTQIALLRRGPQDLPHVGIAKVCLNVRFIGHQPGEDMIVIEMVAELLYQSALPDPAPPPWPSS